MLKVRFRFYNIYSNSISYSNSVTSVKYIGNRMENFGLFFFSTEASLEAFYLQGAVTLGPEEQQRWDRTLLTFIYQFPALVWDVECGLNPHI